MLKRMFAFLMLLSVVFFGREASSAYQSVLARGQIANSSPIYGEIAHLGGDVFQVAESGGLAYAVIGRDFVVFDTLSSPPAMLYRGAILSETSSVDGLNVSGGYAYLLDRTGTLSVVDVHTPDSPALAARSKLSVTWNNVVDTLIVDNLYILVYDDSGTPAFTLVDISDPLHPLQKGTYQDAGTSYGFNALAVWGNYAYAATLANNMLILDISDPASPALAATYATSSPTVSVAAQGNYLYLNEGGSHLKILELTQPLAPKEVGSYNTTFDAVAVDGERAYLFNFFAVPPVMEVVNISVPASPVSEGTTSLTDFYASWFQGSILYLADSTGLNRWNFIPSSAPTHDYVYRHTLPDARDMALDSDYLIVAGGLGYAGEAEPKGLWVVDISSPSAPVQVASLLLPGTVQNVSSLDLQGNIAAVAESRGVHLVDVAQPLTPTLLSYFNANLLYGTPQAVISDTYLFAGDVDSTYIVDISAPMTPTGVLTFTGTSAWGTFALQGHFAYANSDSAGFRIFDISNPANPALQSTTFVTPSISSVAAYGDYAYAGDASGGDFVVVDVSTPSSPSVVGTVTIPGESRTTRLEVANGRLYVYGKSGEVHVYDLSTPSAPVHLTTILSPAVDIQPDGTRLYVADGHFGMRVLQDFPYQVYLPMVVR